MKMIGMWRVCSRCLISSAVCSPSRRGICTSRRITAKVWRKSCRSASSPERALTSRTLSGFKVASSARRFSGRSSGSATVTSSPSPSAHDRQIRTSPAPAESAASPGSRQFPASSKASSGRLTGMYNSVSMDATGSRGTASPLASLLRSRVERVLDSWETGGSVPGYGPGKAALRRFIAALDELVEAAEELEGRGEARREPSAEDAPAAPCALLVTDDEKLSADLRRALEPAFRVDFAATAEEAAATATERSPDVLFAAGARAAEAVQRLRGLLP